MKKPNKLYRCHLCKRPTTLLKLDSNNWKKNFEVQGPKTHPNIERWCGGECYGPVVNLLLLLDEYENLNRKNIRATLEKTLKELIRFCSLRDCNGKKY